MVNRYQKETYQKKALKLESDVSTLVKEKKKKSSGMQGSPAQVVQLRTSLEVEAGPWGPEDPLGASEETEVVETVELHQL